MCRPLFSGAIPTESRQAEGARSILEMILLVLSFDALSSFFSLPREQQRLYQLTVTLSAEQEKNESIHQLDAYKRKQQRLNSSDKAFPMSASINGNDEVSISDTQQASETLSTQNPSVRKVVPVYRRAKVRGAFLQDTEDVNDS